MSAGVLKQDLSLTFQIQIPNYVHYTCITLHSSTYHIIIKHTRGHKHLEARDFRYFSISVLILWESVQSIC